VLLFENKDKDAGSDGSDAKELELIDGDTTELDVIFEDSVPVLEELELIDGDTIELVVLEVKVMTVVMRYEVVWVLMGQLITFDAQLVMVKISVVLIVVVTIVSEDTGTIEDDGVAEAIEDAVVVQFMLVQLEGNRVKELRSSALAMS